MAGDSDSRFLVTAKLETDQPRETVRLQRPLWLEGVTFWTVADSVRHWAMHHDTFTASLFTGPRPSARATWHSRGEARVVAPGGVQLMAPGETHRTTAVSEPASFFVLWWTPEAMKVAARELGVSAPVQFTHAQLELPSVTAALRGLHDAVNVGESRLEIEHFYVESTAQLLRHAGPRELLPPRAGRHHPSVRRAKEFLHDSFAANVSLDDLARATNLSKFHLARCFRECTGMAPHQYQKLLRLQAARRLLEIGETVRSAASTAGFADASHLTRAFREWLGVSPGQWALAASRG
ncbi:MAG: AraC family transcriptional regulator [Myxococcales bacterium]